MYNNIKDKALMVCGCIINVTYTCYTGLHNNILIHIYGSNTLSNEYGKSYTIYGATLNSIYKLYCFNVYTTYNVNCTVYTNA